MKKHYNYLDIDLDSSKIYRRLSAMQGDIKSRYILVNLYSNNLAYDLTNCNVKIYGIKKDTTVFFNNAVIIDALKGQFEIELTNQALAVSGELKIQILILGATGEKLTSSAFFINVGESIVDENAIESTNEFNALTEGLAGLVEYDIYKQNVSAHEEKLNDHDAQFNTIEQDFNSQMDEKATKEDAINVQSFISNPINQILKKITTNDNIVNSYNTLIFDGSETPTSNTTTRIINLPISENGYITEINIKVITAGTVKVKIFDKTDTSVMFNFLREYSYTVVPGNNTFVVNIPVKKNQYIGFYSSDTQLYYKNDANSTYFFLSGDVASVNTVFSLAGSAFAYSLSWKVKKSEEILPLQEVDNTLNQFSSKYSLCNTHFNILPSEWTNNGFTINNGLSATGTGSTNFIAYWNIYSTLDKHTLRARVKVNDVNSQFALFKKYGLQGGIGVIDLQNKFLKLYKTWNGGVLPDVVANKPITLNVATGKEYLIQLDKKSSSHILTITDISTGQSNSLIYDNTFYPYANYAGKQWGSPGVMFLQGNITVKQFEFLTTMPQCPKVLIMGDSITEGFGLDSGKGYYSDRWCAKISDMLYGNCVISGRGSGDVVDLVQRMDFDLDKFKPKYVILAIGTNDVVLNNNVDTYKTNIDIAINKILDKGAIPILCCPPTNATNMSAFQQIYDYVNAKPYTIIHFNYATSLNNDGVTYDASLFLDGTHPTVVGHLKMFKQALIEAPEIFE